MKRKIFKVFSAAIFVLLAFSCANEAVEINAGSTSGSIKGKARLVLNIGNDSSRTILSAGIGTWNFTLTAKKGKNIVYFSKDEDFQAEVGNNNLSFALQEMSPASGNGSLDVTLYFDKYQYVV